MYDISCRYFRICTIYIYIYIFPQQGTQTINPCFLGIYIPIMFGLFWIPIIYLVYDQVTYKPFHDHGMYEKMNLWFAFTNRYLQPSLNEPMCRIGPPECRWSDLRFPMTAGSEKGLRFSPWDANFSNEANLRSQQGRFHFVTNIHKTKDPKNTVYLASI